MLSAINLKLFPANYQRCCISFNGGPGSGRPKDPDSLGSTAAEYLKTFPNESTSEIARRMIRDGLNQGRDAKKLSGSISKQRTKLEEENLTIKKA